MFNFKCKYYLGCFPDNKTASMVIVEKGNYVNVFLHALYQNIRTEIL